MSVLLSVCFVSCSKDDDENENKGIDASAIVDTWESTWSKGVCKYINHPEENYTWDEAVVGDERSRIVLKADGTGQELDGDGGDDSFTWKLIGDELSITDKGGQVSSVAILSLSNSKMVLATSGQETDEDFGTCNIYNELTYEKVK